MSLRQYFIHDLDNELEPVYGFIKEEFAKALSINPDAIALINSIGTIFF
jgi:hypothetical protein